MSIDKFINDVNWLDIIGLHCLITLAGMLSLDFDIWLSFLSLSLGMVLSNHRSSHKYNIVQ